MKKIIYAWNELADYIGFSEQDQKKLLACHRNLILCRVMQLLYLSRDHTAREKLKELKILFSSSFFHDIVLNRESRSQLKGLLGIMIKSRNPYLLYAYVKCSGYKNKIKSVFKAKRKTVST